MVAKTRTIGLSVSGASVAADVEARLTLADFLREDLDLTGTHLACEHGVCGNCTVLVDGASARSCLMFAVQADGCAVTTVEGLSSIRSRSHSGRTTGCSVASAPRPCC